MGQEYLEATPLMADGTLYIATPFNRIIALDAETGKEKWAFDPKLNRIGYYGDDFTCRGLASRTDPQLQPGQECRKTLYEATLDGRLIAVDAETGKACGGLSTAGQVSLTAGIDLDSGIDHIIPGEYHFMSAPAVVGDIVVVGSAIDGSDYGVWRCRLSGRVRGYNARSGALVWAWDPITARFELIRRGGPGKMARTAGCRQRVGSPIGRSVARFDVLPYDQSQSRLLRRRAQGTGPVCGFRGGVARIHGKGRFRFQVVRHDV